MSTPTTPISLASSDWAFDALTPHIPSLHLQLAKGQHPTVRLAYIVRNREPQEHRWNWCPTCHGEIRVRHVHQNVVACQSCGQRFVEQHEGTLANEDLQSSPGYSGPYHDVLSAVWYEWSLRPLRPSPWPDGALAFTVTPFKLPTRSVDLGIKTLTRMERRHKARHGHRGRRGSMSVPTIIRVWGSEPYEPEGWREAAPMKQMGVARDGLAAVPELRMCFIEYRRTMIGWGVRICQLCECEFRAVASVYVGKDAPAVMELFRRRLSHAAYRVGVGLQERGQCFCSTSRIRPLKGL